MNHSGGSVGMTREGPCSATGTEIVVDPPEGSGLSPLRFFVSLSRTSCDRCGRGLFPGDWPWCKNNPDDHTRPGVLSGGLQER